MSKILSVTESWEVPDQVTHIICGARSWRHITLASPGRRTELFLAICQSRAACASMVSIQTAGNYHFIIGKAAGRYYGFSVDVFIKAACPSTDRWAIWFKKIVVFVERSEFFFKFKLELPNWHKKLHNDVIFTHAASAFMWVNTDHMTLWTLWTGRVVL